MIDQNQDKNTATALSTEDVELIKKMRQRSKTKRPVLPPIMVIV
jgi:hypothetical protein